VLKPLALSASRGVIRVNNADQFMAAFRRIAHIVKADDVQLTGDAAQFLIAEAFVDGLEVALEGLLVRGTLHTLALFDKPDPLNGPYFEETIYVTPSRLPAAVQVRVRDVTARACTALGLTEGPVHAEVRINDDGPWIIEVAARSIGGLCSRTLRFGTGMSLEEIILRHALDWPIDTLDRQRAPAGVMMIPIPRAGRLRGVDGQAAAASVADVEEVVITAHIGQDIVPLPEGWQYLGFIFARADTPERVEEALRDAHSRLTFDIV
jgi:biotin carboxylase